MTSGTREQVLILGNGVSRLLLAREIAEWTGEIWGCNYAFREAGVGERLSRLTGHDCVLGDADAYRAEHGLTYEIWAGHLGKSRPEWKLFTCPGEFRKDSGTTLVAQALHEGRDVNAAGFDLGGPDIHSPRLWTQNKTSWVRRWRDIGQRYGWDRITFWGHDHKPFLEGQGKPWAYQRRYRSGIPHIPGDEYRALFSGQYGDGVGEYPGEDDRVVKFRFANGYTTELKESIALAFERRGQGQVMRDQPPALELSEVVDLDLADDPESPGAEEPAETEVASAPDLPVVAHQAPKPYRKARSRR